MNPADQQNRPRRRSNLVGVVLVRFLMAVLALNERVGRWTIAMLAIVGRLTLFVMAAFWATFSRPWYARAIAQQLLDIGFRSLLVTGLTCLFAGMVLTLQSYIGFSRLAAESAISKVVALSITRELAPVLTGLMITSRSGSAMAAELAYMRVNEQINALNVLSVDPFRFLVVPRLVACVVCLPLLVFVGDVIGIFGGYVLAAGFLGFDGPAYLASTWEFLTPQDVLVGLIKALVFGTLIALISCYHGFSAGAGARGVGQATTTAVAISAMAILVSNFVVTALLS